MLRTTISSLALILLCFDTTFVFASPITTISAKRNNDKPFAIFSAKGLSSLESIRQKYEFQSFNLALVKKGNDGAWIKEAHSLGAMNSNGTPVDDMSLYAIGSNSKLFTVLSIGMLIENKTALPGGGFLSFDTKLKDIFGGDKWDLMDKDMEQNVTVQDFLSMRSGLPRHDLSHGRDTPAQVVYKMRYLRPSATLESKTYQYSNAHYFVASEIIPTLTGTPFVDFVQQHVLDPLGMKHTYYNATVAASTGHRVQGFFREGFNRDTCAKAWNTTGKMDASCLGKKVAMGWWVDGDGVNEAGAGGISTCSQDMTTWLQELLEPNVLSASMINRAYAPQTPQTDIPFQGSEIGNRTYGMGQWSYKYRGFDVVEHGGGIPGQVSLHVRVPSRNLGFLLSMNDGGPPGTDSTFTAAYTILDDIIGLDPIDWESRLMVGPMRKGAAPTPPLPTNPTAPPPESAMLGSYADPGYGNFSLVTVDPSSPPTGVISEIIKAYKAYAPGPINLSGSGPVYIATLPERIFVSHIMFTHFNSSAFIWTAINARTIPNDQSGKHAIATQGVGQSIVASGKGIAMFGNFWGGAAGKQYTGQAALAAAAEVWFAKM